MGFDERLPEIASILFDSGEYYLIPDLGRTLVRRTGGQFKRASSTEYDRRHTPWLQPPIDPDDPVAPPEENDVDREAHEEHVHPHERGETPILE